MYTKNTQWFVCLFPVYREPVSQCLGSHNTGATQEQNTETGANTETMCQVLAAGSVALLLRLSFVV